jgi:hypothetical protein
VTDLDLLAQKLVFIETCVQELRTLARPAEIQRDVREARFVLVEHRLADLTTFAAAIRARLG